MNTLLFALSDIGFTSLLVISLVMLVLFGTMLYLIAKKKTNTDQKLRAFTAQMQQMLAKQNSTQAKIAALHQLLARIQADAHYRKDPTWQTKVEVCVYEQLARIHQVIGNTDTCIEICTKIITLDPANALAYHNRGSLYSHQQQYQAAIEDLSSTIELNPRHADAYNNRGACHFALHHYEAAIDDYSHAIQIAPSCAAYHNRANALYALHTPETNTLALSDYRQALLLLPPHAETNLCNQIHTAIQELEENKEDR